MVLVGEARGILELGPWDFEYDIMKFETTSHKLHFFFADTEHFASVKQRTVLATLDLPHHKGRKT